MIELSQHRATIVPRLRMGWGWIFLAGVGTLTQLAHAQNDVSSAIGFEIGEQGGKLPVPSIATPASSSLLSVAHASVLGSWHAGPIEAIASLAMASASGLGIQRNYSLGLFHIAAHSGPVTLLLGLEQHVGVTMSLHKIVQHDTIDTLSGEGHHLLDSLSQQNPTLSVRDGSVYYTSTTLSAAIVRTSDIVGGIGWGYSAVHLTLVAGLPATEGLAGRWVGVNAELAAGDGMTLALSARQESQHEVVRAPPISIGLRMTRWPALLTRTVSPRPIKASTVTQSSVHTSVDGPIVHVQVLLPAAHHVAITGDLTDWQPVEMTHERDGWWGISLPYHSSMSRVQLRSDEGTWGPIPGLPTTQDEYGGEISLLMLVSGTTPAP